MRKHCKRLDAPPTPHANLIDADAYNRALNLPPGTLRPPTEDHNPFAIPDAGESGSTPESTQPATAPAQVSESTQLASPGFSPSTPSTPASQPVESVATQPGVTEELSAGVQDQEPPTTRSAPTQNAESVQADRLLTLENGRWVTQPLPAVMQPGARRVVLIFARDTQARPTLVTTASSGGLLTWSPQEDTDEWVRTEHALSLQGKAWDASVISDQLVVAVQGGRDHSESRGDATQPATTWRNQVTLYTVRHAGLVSIGEVALNDAPRTSGRAWTMTSWGVAQGAVISWGHEVSEDQASGIEVHVFDFHGPVGSAFAVPMVTFNPVAESSGVVLLLVVATVGVVLMLIFWKRDGPRASMALPVNLAPADLLKRGMAGLIDVSVGLGVAMGWSGRSLLEITQHWPGNAETGAWSAIWPGVVVIAVTVFHTTLTEVLTTRTLGKALLGLRVTDLTGRPPGVWRLVGRGLLKPLDMVAVLLLILPVIFPTRQRVADLVTRTLVVTSREPSEMPPTGLDNAQQNKEADEPTDDSSLPEKRDDTDSK